jgi:4a-hydroxytetrahydrobiopterin dehydratase
MDTVTQELRTQRCRPCEGGVPPLGAADAAHYAAALAGWDMADGGKVIAKRWRASHFRHAMRLVNAIADLADAENHHPDLHLTGFRHLRVELTTHAIGGLSLNDFIVAAKIDALPLPEGVRAADDGG